MIGRPPKGRRAMTNAERQQAWRDRQKRKPRMREQSKRSMAERGLDAYFTPAEATISLMARASGHPYHLDMTWPGWGGRVPRTGILPGAGSLSIVGRAGTSTAKVLAVRDLRAVAAAGYRAPGYQEPVGRSGATSCVRR